MDRWRSRLPILWIAVALAGCGRTGPVEPDLSRDERLLVDLYVRITVLEQAREDFPDLSEAGFQRLARSYDSTAVKRALERLAEDPQRWEQVYSAIAKRLHEIEEDPDPGAALREALRPSGEAPQRKKRRPRRRPQQA
jgi:hypothetical protein